ncbi:MAG: methylenetetrahydrofolate reductase [Novosphingobium lindaniclasticum]|jgi:methylenetetrahydrofolate reductase (NADPH)|uniref:Methylenetetrahydrofolate reductase n=1 Tax=Novosphingobium lindaniclasticum LE124 TaxID=1096930 RepID=T0I262_9SPHN|nr:methylenetetrahydrofolate reductase [NAD(P)H] [Novosphingobium lindaniclasticum]EQB19382.1 5,10-methylenetetrahydrofolate reductase [Novosphingobium lindaniclasticum LE124]MDF2637512.1 methylenetetrahydrofolate reductase [Novosphingobium lindaniclasticum]
MTFAERPVSAPLFEDLPGDISVSFEFFPPKTEKMEEQLWDAITQLAPLDPSFVSVTYGAGGSTRERTHSTVSRLVRETSLVPAAHLTCVGASKDEIAEIADQYWEAGVRHIVALRGDPPPAQGGVFTPHPEGYSGAADLVAGLKARHDFDISVAAYPEIHPEAASADADLDNLKRKLDAGANRAITQFFFSTDAYFRFLDKALAAGIATPILPGIMPVTSFAAIRRMSGNTEIPGWLEKMFEGLDERPGPRALVAAVAAADLCRRLYQGGVRDFHFYTLNRAEQAYAICQLLGLRPKAEA